MLQDNDSVLQREIQCFLLKKNDEFQEIEFHCMVKTNKRWWDFISEQIRNGTCIS